MKDYFILKNGNSWFVRKKWWCRNWLFPGLFVAGTGPFDEREFGFMSEEIAQAAIEKYPNGEKVVMFPGLPIDPLLTDDGQRALLDKAKL